MAEEHFLPVDQRREPSPPGEVARGLEALWRTVTARPLWLPPNFFRYLRLSRNVDTRRVRRDQVRVTAPPQQLPHCRACSEICCIGKNNTVSLRLVDTATLIDLDREGLMTTEKPVFTAAELRASPARATLVGSPAYRRLPVMGQDEQGRCRALTDDNRCSLYPNWPVSCARFPYALDLQAGEIFDSKRCASHQQATREDLGRINGMVDATLAAYNERIRDCILLEYAPEGLQKLGIARFLLD